MRKMERKDIAIILGLFFVALVIRAAGVSSVFLYSDEPAYWHNANLILANNWYPSEGVFKYTNPFLSYLIAVVTVIFGGEFSTLRMISVIFGSLTVPLLYLFGSAMYNRRVGLLSSLFLCFSAYHCIYSRVLMVEALTLFFVTAFLYFFWLSQRSEGRKSTTYAIIAGAMMGLAIDAKYLSLFLVPAVLAYVLWTRRFNLKALLDKRVVLVFVFAFLFFSPLLTGLYAADVGLYPLHFHMTERFEKTSAVNVRVGSFSPDELLVRSCTNILGVLSRGAKILPLVFGYLFRSSAMLLFLMGFLLYLPNLKNREREGTFLIFSILTLYIVLLRCARHEYYLIYSLPSYLVMLSYLAVKFFDHLKIRKENSYKNIFRIFVLLLTVIMLFSYSITGITSPYWDKGETAWIQGAVDYIQTDVTKDSSEGHIIIGAFMSAIPIDYYIHNSDFNASVDFFFGCPGEYASEKRSIDLNKIKMDKPDYMIASELEYESLFSEQIKKEIFTNYKKVVLDTYPHRCIVFKRIKEEKIDSTEGTEIPINGEISQEIFDRSIPGVMKVGKIHTVLVQVRNTCGSRADFKVRVDTDPYTIFVEHSQRSITLDKSSTTTLKFKMVPLKEYTGELPVTADLYVKYEENGTCRTYKIDSISDHVRLIER